MKISYISATILALICLSTQNAGAREASCASVKKISGSDCATLQISFDLSACKEKETGATEIKCNGDSATATIESSNHIYSAQFQVSDSWGEKSFSQIGEVKKSASLNMSRPKIKQRESVGKIALQTNKKESERVLSTEKEALPHAIDTPLIFSGTFDGFYSFNSNRPGIASQPAIGTANGNSSYRAYDSFHNSFGLNLAELSFKKTSGEVGFLTDFDFGQQVDQNHIGSGSLILTDPNTGTATTYQNIAKTDEVSKHIGQAYLTYTPSWGNGLALSFGKMYTHLGYEVAKAKDNWQYSRSYTYWYAMPVWHIGVAASYPVYSDKIAFSAFLYNGWNNIYENNTGKTLGAQLKITPNSDFTLIYNIIGGPERTKQNSDWKIVNEANAVWNASSNLSLALEGLVGYEVGVASNGAGAAKWFGTSVHAKYTATPHYWVSPRLEYYRDHNGYTLATSKPENIIGLTFTNGIPIGNGLEIRAEGRMDASGNSDLYSKGDGTVTNYQFTGTFGALFSF